jgi:hypothetical protein
MDISSIAPTKEGFRTVLSSLLGFLDKVAECVRITLLSPSPNNNVAFLIRQANKTVPITNLASVRQSRL